MAKNIFETLVGAIVLLVALGFVILAYRGGTVDKPSGMYLTAKFDRVDGLSPGADVRVSGMVIGSVSSQTLDPENYLAIITLSIDDKVKIPEDSAAEILSDGLLGAKYVAIVPGGSETALKNGEEITITQPAISIESLIGKFMFGGAGDEKKANTSSATTSAPSEKDEDDIF